jgi:hypothetical protein
MSVQAGARESVPCGVAVDFVTVGGCWSCVWQQARSRMILYGIIKTAVVGRAHYTGGKVRTSDKILLERHPDWPEVKRDPNAVRCSGQRGTIGFIAADYHLKLLAYLVDNTEEYLCEAEVDDDEECVNNKNVLDVIIKVR